MTFVQSRVIYLAGHKQPETTARYLRPQKDAATEVLRAAAGARAGAPSPGASRADLSPFGGEVKISPTEYWRHSGRGNSDDVRVELLPPESKNPGPLETAGVFPGVRGGGIEPPWLLTASTSNHAGASKDAISRTCERQQTSASAQERRISAACSQNPPDDDEDIDRLLSTALQTWRRGRDRAELRAYLFGLLTSISRPPKACMG